MTIPTPLLEALRCPDDASPIEASPDGPRCSGCGRVFHHADGVLSMLPAAEPHADVLSERRQRDREAGLYDRIPALRLLSLWEVPLTLAPFRRDPPARVVEVGSGTGRISLPLSRLARECLFVDHSLASLQVLRGKLDTDTAGRALLIQADAAALPVRDGWADALLSCQMLEHLPTPGLRERSVAEMARVLTRGGRMALSAYWRAPLLRAVLEKEGKHSGEIYFHRFERDELADLLKSNFKINRMTGRLIYILLAHAVRM